MAQSREAELEGVLSITQRRESIAVLLGQLVRAVEDDDPVDDGETPNTVRLRTPERHEVIAAWHLIMIAVPVVTPVVSDCPCS